MESNGVPDVTLDDAANTAVSNNAACINPDLVTTEDTLRDDAFTETETSDAKPGDTEVPTTEFPQDDHMHTFSTFGSEEYLSSKAGDGALTSPVTLEGEHATTIDPITDAASSSRNAEVDSPPQVSAHVEVSLPGLSADRQLEYEEISSNRVDRVKREDITMTGETHYLVEFLDGREEFVSSMIFLSSLLCHYACIQLHSP